MVQLKSVAEDIEMSFFRNVLVVSTKFTCYATKRKYKIRGTLTCNTKNNLFDNL